MKSQSPSSLRAVLGTVLIVEDSTMERAQFREAFESGGFAVEEAAEGVEGLWRARNNRYAAIVTDIHMPTMDGLEFLDELRKVPGCEDVPVYVVTSDCSRERMRVGKELGVQGWVVKPVRPDELVVAVRGRRNLRFTG